MNKIIKQITQAIQLSEQARKEGLLTLEDELDKNLIRKRDIFYFGLQYVIDGTDCELIEKILNNLIKTNKKDFLLKTIQKEAVLSIQRGDNTRILFQILTSFLKDKAYDKVCKELPDYVMS